MFQMGGVEQRVSAKSINPYAQQQGALGDLIDINASGSNGNNDLQQQQQQQLQFQQQQFDRSLKAKRSTSAGIDPAILAEQPPEMIDIMQMRPRSVICSTTLRESCWYTIGSYCC
jgi:hypothetical protein